MEDNIEKILRKSMGSSAFSWISQESQGEAFDYAFLHKQWEKNDHLFLTLIQNGKRPLPNSARLHRWMSRSLNHKPTKPNLQYYLLRYNAV
jgi:hypothetical protein